MLFSPVSPDQVELVRAYISSVPDLHHHVANRCGCATFTIPGERVQYLVARLFHFPFQEWETDMGYGYWVFHPENPLDKPWECAVGTIIQAAQNDATMDDDLRTISQFLLELYERRKAQHQAAISPTTTQPAEDPLDEPDSDRALIRGFFRVMLSRATLLQTQGDPLFGSASEYQPEPKASPERPQTVEDEQWRLWEDREE